MLFAVALEHGLDLAQKGVRVGVALDFLKHLEHDLAQPLVVPSGRKQVTQRQKAFVLAVVPGFEDGFHALLLHFRPFALVRDAEIGRQAEGSELFAHQLQAEGMDGRDLRPVDEQQLAAQPGIVRPLTQTFGNGVRDLAAHLGRRRARVSYEQQAVDVSRARFIGQAAQHPLNEHRRLARTGRRRHQQRAAVFFDGGPLFIRPLRHGPPLLPRVFPKIRCPLNGRARAPGRPAFRQTGRRRGIRTSRIAAPAHGGRARRRCCPP